MDQYQQLLDVLTRARPRQSKAASLQPEMITICKIFKTIGVLM
jgi:hypothetical protein